MSTCLSVRRVHHGRRVCPASHCDEWLLRHSQTFDWFSGPLLQAVSYRLHVWMCKWTWTWSAKAKSIHFSSFQVFVVLLEEIRLWQSTDEKQNDESTAHNYNTQYEVFFFFFKMKRYCVLTLHFWIERIWNIKRMDSDYNKRWMWIDYLSRGVSMRILEYVWKQR